MATIMASLLLNALVAIARAIPVFLEVPAIITASAISLFKPKTLLNISPENRHANKSSAAAGRTFKISPG